ncbi:HNH endonuclease signature motif containing protein [uncultured Sphaerochaeta sp.]|uniref:HNH endonuclease signature motif containing protein n=1 Tax=uncultured Sphaerochaeta sp. TaxID=886478 RepID=UPI002A0A2941|nr:HNH endonuclease signature motif containing protein [uncultured Sphaerochaeta sp.]
MSRKKTEMRIRAEAAGIKYATIYNRIQSGMSVDEAFMTPVRGSRWSKKVHDFIYEHYQGIDNQELASLINKKLGTNFTREQIKVYKNNHHLDSGLTGHYSKGHVPANKGKKLEEFMESKTLELFKSNFYPKGHSPHNTLPIGTEILRPDGYTWVKISGKNQWRQKHRILFETYHGSKIPAGKCVTFLDGDRQNFTMENLALISKDENKYLNKMGLRFKDKNMTNTGIALARLKSTIAKKERS